MLNDAQRRTARQTDADLALDHAVDNLAANRLTVEQIMELSHRYVMARLAVERMQPINKHSATVRKMNAAKDELRAAIAANHIATKTRLCACGKPAQIGDQCAGCDHLEGERNEDRDEQEESDGL